MIKIDKNSTIKFLLFACVIVIAGQFVLLCTISGNLTKIKKHFGDLNATKTTVEYRNCELQCIGRQIPDSLKLFSYDSYVLAKDAFLGRKTLIYFFSQVQCKMCIESQIEVIKAVFATDSTNIVLLANSSNIRELHALRQINGLKCSIYKIDQKLGMPCDSAFMPYFLLIDENLKVINAFITMKERMNYSVAYLKSMYRYFHSEDTMANAFDIAIDRKQIDLGNVKNGSTKNVVFTIANNSDQDVQLDVIPDCDCTTIDCGENILQAHEKRQVAATIKFGEEGEFVKYIYVYFNNNQKPIEVEICGCVN
jgi:hypothetical protein